MDRINKRLPLREQICDRQGIQYRFKSDVNGNRYKNRWSEDEIMALKKGVTRFEKKNKKRADESSGSEKARGLDGGKKGETEQMWEHILGT